MQNPAVREQAVAQLREKSKQRRADAETRAMRRGYRSAWRHRKGK